MSRRQRTALVAAVAAGALLRLVRLAGAPLMHPDGPAYLGLAEQWLGGHVTRVLGDYYSPLFPALVAAVAALGIPLEVAGRLAATLPGVAALPLLWLVARRLFDRDVALVATIVAALQPALVKSAADILPETLAGALLLAWLATLYAERPLLAGSLAGAFYLTRPEGILLVPLGVGWLLARRASPRDHAAYVAAALLVMLPALLAVHARTGAWQLSPREARTTSKLGMPGEPTFLAALVHHPSTLLLVIVRGALRQTLYDAKALSPLLWVPFAVGLAGLGLAGRAAWLLAVAAAFTVLPLALNPSPRYAVPLLPLLLPWVASGLLVLGRRLGAWAPAAGALFAGALTVQALWVGKPFDVACSREVSQMIVERYGTGQALVAVDGRFAYGARGRALVPRSTRPEDALALAQRHGARLWLTRPAWIRAPWQPPPGARVAARPCRGAFVLFELDGP